MNADLGHLLMLIDAAKQNPMSMLDARNRDAIFTRLVVVLNGHEARLAKLETLLTSKGAPDANA